MGPHARGGAPRLEVTRRWVTEIACPGFTSTRSAARTSSACLRSLARPDVGARRAAPRGDSEMSLRILLADDHVIVRQGVKNLLVGEGYKVVGEATDGGARRERAEVRRLHRQPARGPGHPGALSEARLQHHLPSTLRAV